MKKIVNAKVAATSLLTAFGVSLVSLSGAYAADNTAISNGLNAAHPTGAVNNLTGTNGIFTTIVNVLLFIVGAISVIMLIVGGIRYTMSNGDEKAVVGAKNTIMYAIVGLIVAFLAFAIVNWVLSALGGNTQQ